MRTPRQILIERHHAVVPKLDALRRDVVAGLAQVPTHAAHPRALPSGLVSSWRSILLTFRWHAAGLSAAWLLVALLNSGASPAEGPAVLQPTAPWSRQLLAALRENRRQIVELLQTPATASEPAPDAPAFVPKHRGDVSSSNSMA